MTASSEAAEQELVVVEVADPASGVRSLRLAAPDGTDLPVWTAGAHVDLCLDEGLVRQYSLCGRPDDRDAWTVAVLREPDGRGGSAYVHDKVAIGDRIVVRGPRNNFALAPASHYVFVAGGIGITPLLPMIAAAEAAGADWSLDYGGRSRGSMAFLDDLVAAHPSQVRAHPQDEAGLLDLEGIVGTAPPDAVVYACGPAPLLDAIDMVCRAVGRELHVERFTAAQVDEGPDSAFEVELAESGLTLNVPSDRPILAVLEEAGIPILSSCFEGTFGTCATAALAGEVDHRDALLTAEERAANDVMFVCVSRAACPRLVLAL